MSSYLSFYIVPKKRKENEEKRHILILSYSRSSEIYQYVHENINPAFVGSDGEKYTTLDKENLGTVMRDIRQDIAKVKERLELYEKYASSNADLIEDVISQREYLKELEFCESQLCFIEDLVDNAEFYKEVEEVCCNID